MTRKIKKRMFKLGDRVFKLVICLQKKEKFNTNWKVPYIVSPVDSKDAYFMQNMDGKILELP